MMRSWAESSTRFESSAGSRRLTSSSRRITITAPSPVISRISRSALVAEGRVGVNDPYGYSVSGFVRTAALLTLGGLKAYDGAGCRNVPILSGILFDGTELYPTKNDPDGVVCGKGQSSTSPRYLVPKPVPPGSIVV